MNLFRRKKLNVKGNWIFFWDYKNFNSASFQVDLEFQWLNMQ